MTEFQHRADLRLQLILKVYNPTRTPEEAIGVARQLEQFCFEDLEKEDKSPMKVPSEDFLK